MQRDTHNRPILIVDDMPDNIALLASALEHDHELQFAQGGEEALALIEREPPSLVLLDVMMPGIDGLETLQRLRQREASRELPVILVTADNRVETQVRGLDLGANDFLNKPIEIKILRARIRNVLERSRLMQEQVLLYQQLEQAHRELQRLAEFNSALLASAGEGIYSVDLAGRCTSINPAALRMLGFSEPDVLWHDQHQLFHHRHADGSTYPEDECPIFATLQDGQSRKVDELFLRSDGSHLAVHLSVTALYLDGIQIGAEVLFQPRYDPVSNSDALHRSSAITADQTG